MTRCECCDHSYEEDQLDEYELYSGHHIVLCEQCRLDEYCSCDSCGNIAPGGDIESANGDDLCPVCYEKYEGKKTMAAPQNPRVNASDKELAVKLHEEFLAEGTKVLPTKYELGLRFNDVNGYLKRIQDGIGALGAPFALIPLKNPSPTVTNPNGKVRDHHLVSTPTIGPKIKKLLEDKLGKDSEYLKNFLIESPSEWGESTEFLGLSRKFRENCLSEVIEVLKEVLTPYTGKPMRIR